MNTYRSRQTIEAVQYEGVPIPDVTCEGTPEQRKQWGCTFPSPHAHTKSPGGYSPLSHGDWITPEPKGSPFAVTPDARFRAYFEVPETAE